MSEDKPARRYPRTVEAAILKLAELGTSENWADFAKIGKYNTFRWLKKYGLVVDQNAEARHAALEEDRRTPYERFPAKWGLTERGERAVAFIREFRPNAGH